MNQSSGVLKIYCSRFFPRKSLSDRMWPWCKIGHGQLGRAQFPMLQTKFQGHLSFSSWGPAEKIFKGFYHIWTWWPSWSFDQGPMNKLFFSHPMQAPHVICFYQPDSLRLIIVLGFNNTSTLVDHLVSSPRERKKKDSSGEEREC